MINFPQQWNSLSQFLFSWRYLLLKQDVINVWLQITVFFKYFCWQYRTDLSLPGSWNQSPERKMTTLNKDIWYVWLLFVFCFLTNWRKTRRKTISSFLYSHMRLQDELKPKLQSAKGLFKGAGQISSHTWTHFAPHVKWCGCVRTT